MKKISIREEVQNKMKDVKKSPLLVIGIAGASASGKSSVLKSISSYLNEENVAHLDLDGYHLHTREERKKLNEYPDEIKANDFDKIIHDIKALMSGENIDMSVYDHKNGVFSSPVKLEPKQIVFVEGLHSVMINEISDQKIIDLSVFLYPDEDLRKSWKVKRDVNERGYSYSEAIEQIANRKAFVTKYIFPQIEIADILIHIHRTKNGSIRYRVLLSPTFYNRCLTDKCIKGILLKYFRGQKVDFKDKQYTEVHLESNTTMCDFLKSKVSQLGLITSQHSISYIKDQYTYAEMVEILFALILTIIAGRNDYGVD